MNFVELARVAELIVETDSGGRRGSGYLVRRATVLTAAHVVDGAKSVAVRFNADRPDERTVTGRVVLTNTDADVAIVTFGDNGEEPVVPSLFGRVGEHAAVVPCTTVGFPRFKLRADTPANTPADMSRYRDSHQAVGKIASLSNWREGSLELTVNAPAPDQDSTRSPWEGMSGAAVWCEGRIVGLVSKHHPSDGLNRLAAVRTDRWLQVMPAAELRLLCESTGLPDADAELVDVVPAFAEDLVVSDFSEQLRAVAPAILRGRERELDDLAQFCAGDDPYLWLQGEPWSGKTALAAWLGLHPPAGVQVVSFFITARFGEQANSAAFTDSLIVQLATLAGEPVRLPTTPAARDAARRRLLALASARVRDRDELLLLIVDGLDEDRGIPPTGPSSIASLLPDPLPHGMRVLVTSRPNLRLPVDVPRTHQMHTCPVRQLGRSAEAASSEVRAKQELAEQLHGADRLTVDLLGHLTASGGGLTMRELMELTQARQVEVEARLQTRLGRSVESQLLRDIPSGSAETLFAFGHETLREVSEGQFTHDLSDYRHQLHRWAATYRDQRWPANTPRFLFRPYERLLVSTGDLTRLSSAAADRARHDRMLDHTLSDGAALDEIADAQQMQVSAEQPDLGALALIALERDRLTHRNDALPVNLPATWVRLGQPHRADGLVRSIADSEKRTHALAHVARAFGALGEVERGATVARAAQRVAREVPDVAVRAWLLTVVAKSWGVLTETEQATSVAREAEEAATEVIHADLRTEVLARAADAYFCIGEPEQALRVAREAHRVAADDVPLDGRVEALAVAAELFSKLGDMDQALRVAHQTQQVAKELVFRHPQSEEAPVRLPGGALFRSIEEFFKRGEETATLARVAEVFATIGEFGEAERAVADLGIGQPRAVALARVSRAMATAGRFEDAERVAAEALRVIRGHEPEEVAQRLGYLAGRQFIGGLGPHRLKTAAVSLVRHVENAALGGRSTQQEGRLSSLWWHTQAVGALLRSPVRSMKNLYDNTMVAIGGMAFSVSEWLLRSEARAVLAQTFAETGQPEVAEELARDVNDVEWRATALAAVATAYSVAQQDHKAVRVVEEIDDPQFRSKVYVRLADQALRTGNAALADQMASRAEVDARSALHPRWQADVQVQVAAGLAHGGHPEAAEQVARGLSAGPHLLTALKAVADGFHAVGQLEEGERIQRQVEDLERRHSFLRQETILPPTRAREATPDLSPEEDALAAAEHLLAAGRLDEAGEVILADHDQAHRAAALVAIASRAPSQAWRLCASLLTRADWYEAVPLLIEVDPSAPKALIAALATEPTPDR